MGVTPRLFAGAFVLAGAIGAATNTELRFAVRADPRTLDPLLATEEVSETIRYLTGGVLIRMNRRTQLPEPELASSWTTSKDGREIEFTLRHDVRFSDGAPFGPVDVLATVNRLNNAGLSSPIADQFRSAGGDIKAQPAGIDRVRIKFSKPMAAVALLFDELAISSARHLAASTAVLGPFFVWEQKSGQFILLKRNPYYWKKGPNGDPLPRAEFLRLEVIANPETALLRYRRGELSAIDKLDADAFDRLKRDSHAGALDLGPSLDTEFFWFNQKSNAPLPAFKLKWFQSTLFRKAMSAAIDRQALARLVYRGYARPAGSFVSEASTLWFNPKLPAPRQDSKLALQMLQEAGFRIQNGVLHDLQGNPVEFSVITNAESKIRSQLALMLQQDLATIGIRVNLAPFEFQSLVERITTTANYESCLLGLTNVENDPNALMNVWLSSGTHHAWNPEQKTPATPWEAELDRLVEQQHQSTDRSERKRLWDRVQEIIAEQAPLIPLVHPDVLVAVSPALHNASPSPFAPHLYWNVEYLAVSSQAGVRK